MSGSWFHLSAMSPRKLGRPPIPKVSATLNRIGVTFGRQVYDERVRRKWRLEDLANAAGMSKSEAHRIEAGGRVSLEACVRVSVALGLEIDLTMTQRRPVIARDLDPVHAALGEVEARQLRPFGHVVRIDEPYQHYQFAGRADVIAADVDARSLLHIENRTRFPDIQAFSGSWNAKRAYLGDELAKRLSIRGGWLSIDHVVVALWSSEVLHSLRMRSATFQAMCPDLPDAFAGWWNGKSIPRGERSTIIVFDPLVGERKSRRRWISLASVPSAETRYRGYADALDRLRAARLA